MKWDGGDIYDVSDVTFTPTSGNEFTALVIYQEHWVRDWRTLWLFKRREDRLLHWIEADR